MTTPQYTKKIEEVAAVAVMKGVIEQQNVELETRLRLTPPIKRKDNHA